MAEHDLSKFYSEMGQRVKIAREKLGMTQEMLAVCLHLTRSSIINIEKGRHRLSIHALLSIAELLHIPYVELIPPLEEVGGDNAIELVKNLTNVVSDQPTDNQDKKILTKFIKFLDKS